MQLTPEEGRSQRRTVPRIPTEDRDGENRKKYHCVSLSRFMSPYGRLSKDADGERCILLNMFIV